MRVARIMFLESHGAGGSTSPKQVLDASSGHQAFRESVGTEDPLQAKEPVGTYVYLLGVSILKQKVAEGLLTSTDPSLEVDGVPLGLDHYQVFVQKAVKSNVRLERPQGGVNTVGEAIGQYIAWAAQDVLMEE